MRDTLQFNHKSIGVKNFGGVPHFCAADIAKCCGYKGSLPLDPQDKPVRSGSFNYVSLNNIGNVLSRPTGRRRVMAQELLAEIEKAYAIAMPVPQPVVSAASVPITSDYDLRVKVNQIDREMEELMAERYEKQKAIALARASLLETEARILERERERQQLRTQQAPAQIQSLKARDLVALNG